SGFTRVRRAVAALYERHRPKGKFDSSAVIDRSDALHSMSATDSPLPSQGRGKGESFAFCTTERRRSLTSILSHFARGEAEDASMKLNRHARCRYHSCHFKAAAFSLVELVLALGVAGFCLFAVFGLMPVGMQTNRNATSQTAATNIIGGIVADLRATPAAATTSPQFAITFGADKTLYFDACGQASTSLSA